MQKIPHLTCSSCRAANHLGVLLGLLSLGACERKAGGNGSERQWKGSEQTTQASKRQKDCERQ